MTPRQLKRIAGQRPVTARIVSDGCRDYVVEVVSDSGAGLLRRGRKPLRFRSLAEVHRLLNRCHVDQAVLRQRVAHEELCGLASDGAWFHDQPVKVAS